MRLRPKADAGLVDPGHREQFAVRGVVVEHTELDMNTAALAAAVIFSVAAPAFAGGTAQDRTFVDKVGPGGMFEVEAGKLAESKASAADVRDFAVMEVHDHTAVGERLRAISIKEGVPLPPSLTPEFQTKLDRLKALSGPAFDTQYMRDMGELHPKDGTAFAKEGASGGSADYRAFGRETHLIVARHIGAIQAANPK